jgi:pimeloyl-ACP methyl ester carboxylesterase
VVSERNIDVGPLSLVATEAGAGGRPLLLVHGFTGNRNDFDPVVEPLAELGWHVVAPDLRGHGDSGRLDDEGAYSFATFADDLVALVDDLGWDTFVLLGHSMGGMVAQTLVLAVPERVRGLVLMDTSHDRVAVDPEMVALGVKIAREEGLETLVAVQRGLDDPLATPAHLRLCATVPGYQQRGDDNTLACSAAMFAAMAQQITEHHDRLADLAAVRCPTLVIVGEQDVPFLEPSERMAATIPGARLAVLADAGHSPQFEAPDEWWRAVGPFLASLVED